MDFIQNSVNDEVELEAYITAEDAAFAHDVTWGEMVAEEEASEDKPFMPTSSPDDLLLSSLFDSCNCKYSYGEDDNGKIRHHH
jgi:hypothetical protein